MTYEDDLQKLRRQAHILPGNGGGLENAHPLCARFVADAPRLSAMQYAQMLTVGSPELDGVEICFACQMRLPVTDHAETAAELPRYYESIRDAIDEYTSAVSMAGTLASRAHMDMSDRLDRARRQSRYEDELEAEIDDYYNTGPGA